MQYSAEEATSVEYIVSVLECVGENLSEVESSESNKEICGISDASSDSE